MTKADQLLAKYETLKEEIKAAEESIAEKKKELKNMQDFVDVVIELKGEQEAYREMVGESFRELISTAGGGNSISLQSLEDFARTADIDTVVPEESPPGGMSEVA